MSAVASLDAWLWVAGARWWEAEHPASSTSPVRRLAAYRQAAGCYAAALQRAGASGEPAREAEVARRERLCWERIVELSGACRVRIAFQGTTLPGVIFPARDACRGERRPLVVINRGGEPISQTWAAAGAAASARGYHWMAFDGPGQGAMLADQGLGLRPDWEAVLTPVLDAVLKRPDVDPRRVAVVGIGYGSYGVARALCFEHRPAAAVLAPGIVDAGTPWTAALTAKMRTLMQAGREHEFDREVHLAELFAPAAVGIAKVRGRAFCPGGSPYQLFRALDDYRLSDELAGFSTPALVLDAGSSGAWPNQAELLFGQLTGDHRLISAWDRSVSRQVLDWLSERFAATESAATNNR